MSVLIPYPRECPVLNRPLHLHVIQRHRVAFECGRVLQSSCFPPPRFCVIVVVVVVVGFVVDCFCCSLLLSFLLQFQAVSSPSIQSTPSCCRMWRDAAIALCVFPVVSMVFFLFVFLPFLVASVPIAFLVCMIHHTPLCSAIEGPLGIHSTTNNVPYIAGHYTVATTRAR